MRRAKGRIQGSPSANATPTSIELGEAPFQKTTQNAPLRKRSNVPSHPKSLSESVMHQSVNVLIFELGDI